MSAWIETLGACADRGVAGVLVTIVRAEGSTPREAGAKLVVTADALDGTIGGGHLEHEATALARLRLAGGEHGLALRRVPLGPSLGQCCGGAATLGLERVLPGEGWLAAVRTHLAYQQACVVVTTLDGPTAGAKLVVGETEVAGSWTATALAAAAVTAAREHLHGARRSATALVVAVAGATLLLDRVAPEPTVVVFGAGHVGRALVRILAGLPCRVTWVDDREAQHPTDSPSHVRVVVTDALEDEADAAPTGAYVLVMTHSHALDLRVVERMLRRNDFAYLGLIGSATKRRRFERRLMARGVPSVAVERMTCPIGLPGIGGKHPGEIAVAVAAELLRVRGQRAAAARASA